MKKIVVLLSVALMALVSCDKNKLHDDNQVVVPPVEIPEGMFTVEAPAPTKQIDRVALDEAQSDVAANTARFAFNSLKTIYDVDIKKKKDHSDVYSPLSLEIALGMLANGVSEASAREISDVLGYGGDVDLLNGYCKTILEQLPAVDLDVKLKLADAFIVNRIFPVQPAYKSIIADYYYSSVENISFDDPEYVKGVVNGWCYRNTEGLIPGIVEEVSPFAAAYILNALYFKAGWSEPFNPDFQVIKDGTFTANGKKQKLDFLKSNGYLKYADMGSYRVLRIPYGNGRFSFNIFLPESVSVSDMLGALAEDWSRLRSSMAFSSVMYRFPKFETESSYNLIEILKKLGINDVFDHPDFDRMFDSPCDFEVSEIIQKAVLKLDEKGTEGAAVTEIGIKFTSAGPGDESECVEFYADRPFAYAITEDTSGTILFTGVMAGK